MKECSCNYALCFDTLSNPLRLEIINSLRKGPHSVSELTKELGAEQSKISHSLKALRECKFVSVSQKGKQRIYSLKKGPLTKMNAKNNVFEMLDEHYKNQCGANCTKGD